MHILKEQENQNTRHIPLVEREFLRMLKEKKEITADDIFKFVDDRAGVKKYGPGIDALGMLNKCLELGIIEGSPDQTKFIYKGFNDPKPAEASAQP